MIRSIYPVLLFGLATFSPIFLEAQSSLIAVTVSVNEEATGNFSNRFNEALKGLGDVEIGGANRPDFRLSALVLCDPDCNNLRQYVVSILVQRPVGISDLNRALPESLVDTPWETQTEMFIPMAAALNAEFVSNWIVAVWSPDTYESQIDEYVARFDARCLEPLRLRLRGAANPAETQRLFDEADEIRSRLGAC